MIRVEGAIDKFGGPGGWDLAALELGIEPLGIEWDDAACATREVAGLRTLQADVAALDPLDFAPCELSIASPPCPTFSNAGLGEGMADMPLVYEAAKLVERGVVPDLQWRDKRSELVVEPLRWALALEPRFLAWEQVPPVLPFWEVCAAKLREYGWNVWTGILSAERYGVAQTRERAFLMADRERGVHPPTPTHQRYVKGEPRRHDITLEGEILPWVSMADALGWSEDDEVGFPRRNDTPSNKPGADDDGEYRERDRRPASEPSFTLGEKVRSWTRERPSPTIVGGSARCEGGTLVYPEWREKRLRMGNQEKATEREADEPAPTVLFGHRMNDVEWVHDRPSTTVAGDPRVAEPGHKKDKDFPDSPGRMENAVRVTLEEAAVLQSFPPDYPFQGTKTKRFEQVGNAVPPLLALAVLKALLE